jgi:hypothetical protein
VLTNTSDPDKGGDSEIQDADDGQDEPADYFRPGVMPGDDLFDATHWRQYSALRDDMLQRAVQSIPSHTGPIYQFVGDERAMQVHMQYEQVTSRSLADAVTYRFFMDRRSRQILTHLATNYGVDSFRCYVAPAGSGVDYLLAADYLDRHTQGVRSVRTYQLIPAPVLDIQWQILLLARPELETPVFV